MILTLDNLAHRYKMLPSQALTQGSTFDLYVLDVYNRHVRHQRDLQEGKDSVTINPKLSVDEMKAMIDRVRERK